MEAKDRLQISGIFSKEEISVIRKALFSLPPEANFLSPSERDILGSLCCKVMTLSVEAECEEFRKWLEKQDKFVPYYEELPRNTLLSKIRYFIDKIIYHYF